MTKQKFPHLFQKHLIVITITVVSIIGLFWISDEYVQTNNLFQSKYNLAFEEKRKLIKDETLRLLKFIEYKKSQTEIQLKATIKEQTYGAHAIAMNIYNENRHSNSNDEIAKMIKDALRPIRFNHGRGYFFATELNGIEQLFADKPELEGQNLIDMQDTKGKFVIKDMIDIVKADGEGFYSYTWTKPEQEGRGYPQD